MKISYRNYPILEKLQAGSLGILPLFEDDKIFFDFYCERFVKNWKLNRENFLHETNVISKPFAEASAKAEKKLIQLWQDIIVNDISDFDVKGCYVCGDYVYMINYEVKKGSEDQEIAFYIFDKKGIPLGMFVDSVKYKIYQNAWISSCFSIDKNNHPEIQRWIYGHLVYVIIFRLFKTFAEVETKVLPANTKVKGIDCKYVNDTKLDLTYLDSKWFTNLVKSDGFNVRGHFRLQPKKKDGEWTKELIWINDFEKTGYTAPARKTAYNEHHQQ